jgi:small subunit ribosomal protein S20
MAKLKTGRHTSAIKEVRKTKRKTERNVTVKSKIKTAVKRAEGAVKSGNLEASRKCLNIVFSEWDKASKKNIVHYKTASNQKARLSKLVAKLEQ